MSNLRKVMWPTAIVGGLLLFFGAIGTTPSAYAATGDVCSIQDEDGNELLGAAPFVMGEGEVKEFTAYFEDTGLGFIFDDFLVDVNLDDGPGDSDITSVGSPGATVPTGPTDHLNAVELFGTIHLDGCGEDEMTIAAVLLAALIDCRDESGLNNGPCPDFDYVLNPGDPQVALEEAGLTLAEVANVAAATIVAGGTCGDANVAVENFLLAEGVTANEAEEIGEDIEDLCIENVFGPGTIVAVDGFLTVDVTCDEPGSFDLSFAPEDGAEARSIEVICLGHSDLATIVAKPPTVEIVPSLGSVAHSLIVVTLTSGGAPSFPGENVIFTTDRCAIETSTVLTAADYQAASALFGAYNVLTPATAADIDDSVFATTGPDANSQQDETLSFASGSSTIAAAILHCDPVHAPGVTPGPAKVTAIIDVEDPDLGDNDLIVSTTVTVVGPPVANGITVTASPATLICGEKATISVDIKDAAGQPVSDHTLVEAVTNFGGVLAGTGAVAGQAGLVSPVSSTVAETFGGKATFYLLTSDTHSGKYEVVVTTGGGGGVAAGGTNILGGLFTTPPISVQVTVECTIPSVVVPVVPPVVAPDAGHGIRPPSTGDAGLASSESTSWTLVAGAAAVAALVAAGFALKTIRNED